MNAGSLEKEELEDQLEQKLTVVAATAIEDKLQDQVPECIASFLEAGMKVWVLTGDKLETAMDIGYSTNLLKVGQKIVTINTFN